MVDSTASDAYSAFSGELMMPDTLRLNTIAAIIVVLMMGAFGVNALAQAVTHLPMIFPIPTEWFGTGLSCRMQGSGDPRRALLSVPRATYGLMIAVEETLARAPWLRRSLSLNPQVNF